jgi:hypothetical protein
MRISNQEPEYDMGKDLHGQDVPTAAHKQVGIGTADPRSSIEYIARRRAGLGRAMETQIEVFSC